MPFANIYIISAIIVIFNLSIAVTSCSTSVPPEQRQVRTDPEAININTATAAELTQIPYIGEKTAERIVAFRNENGPFSRPEELLLVQGVSDQRFRQIRHLIRTE